jgi:hypothetical protein
MIHACMVKKRTAVKMLDGEEVIAIELLTIHHLQMEVEMVMAHQIMEDCTETILEIIEGNPAEGGIDHRTRGIDPQDKDIGIMMAVTHHHCLHLDEHQRPDRQATIPMMAGITG